MGGSGIRLAVGAVVGLCSRDEAGNLIQRACGAMGLGDCTVGVCGFYTEPVSPSTLFDFFAGNLEDWWHPMLQLLSASELKISGLCDATLRLACQILHDLCTGTRALVQLDTGSQQEKNAA
jgi:hypothetical protein